MTAANNASRKIANMDWVKTRQFATFAGSMFFGSFLVGSMFDASKKQEEEMAKIQGIMDQLDQEAAAAAAVAATSDSHVTPAAAATSD
ncbi:hypothetical protein H696_00869 [Fonticula alba]|uniref:Uncharacterized protein n=1 Tax=Fonticula alba TaxID=691883 RepID=A0A058ZHB3_FONAL|nr:hypothetical protein H696_00869 [Fonticula alba]KCV73328.1 hypothetical protein H696_00869 [Fonticula alba]|eukprot:XP_009493029.1 hypothetical protein H696_00869 [Fonticula alba]